MACLGEIVDILSKIPNPPTLDDFKFSVEPFVLDLFNFAQTGTPFFRNPLSGIISQCIADINRSIIILQNNILIPDETKAPIIAVLNNAAGTLAKWNQHITRALVGPLNDDPSFLGQIENNLRIRATVGVLNNVNNACGDIEEFLGSILGKGQELLNKLAEPLNKLLDAINAGLATIITLYNELRNAIVGAISSIQRLIINEINALARLFEDAINWALANTLAALSEDSCAQAVFNAAGTSILLNTIPNFPRF